MKTCVFAGTFDPVSKGHIAVIKRLLNERYRVLIVIGENKDKEPLFTETEREEIIKSAFKGNKRVRVIRYSQYKESYKELLKSLNVKTYARGIRNQADYIYEKNAEQNNLKDYPDIETVYITLNKYKDISSTVIKERIKKGKDVKRYVPKKSYKKLKEILNDKYSG